MVKDSNLIDTLWSSLMFDFILNHTVITKYYIYGTSRLSCQKFNIYL